MKKVALVSVFSILAASMIMTSCNKKEDPKPDEQELITTLKLNVTGSGGFAKTFVYKVENGFGGTTTGTVQIDTIKLSAAQTYSVTAEVLNEKASPVENITEEVLSEKDAHLFLYTSTPGTGAGSLTFSGGSKDSKNLPFNQVISVASGAAGSGKLQVNLIHEPSDKTATTTAGAGGETDVEATFPVLIQ
jgi:hypothetical protein